MHAKFSNLLTSQVLNFLLSVSSVVFICVIRETCPRENEDLWFSVIDHHLPEATL